jgi:hypothetical protein
MVLVSNAFKFVVAKVAARNVLGYLGIVWRKILE